MAYGDYVNSTLQEYGGELSRPTKFNMYLTAPKSIDSTQYDVLCKTIQIPNIKHDDIELKYKGHNLKITGRTNYDQTFSVTFYLDEYHKIRDSIDNWIRMLDPKEISGKSSSASPDNRYGSIKVSARNFNEDFVTYEYQFNDVYPISVSGPEYNTEGVSSVQEITIEFGYSYFVSGAGGGINFSTILQDTVNDIMDKGFEKLGSLFPWADDKTFRNTVPAAVDIFKKLKR